MHFMPFMLCSKWYLFMQCIMRSHEQKWDRTPWWSNIIFPLLGVLSALIFILWGFCPIVLLSILAFICLPTWSHDENVDCPHLYHVITWTEMGSYTLIVEVLKYVLFWGLCPLWFLSFRAFVLSCFCPFWLFSVRPRDRMTRMLIVHTCIMWSHEEKWDRTPWFLEYKNIFSFGGFVHLDFYPLGLLSYRAFVHFGFYLSAHVIAWRECWLSTPVSLSCDHMNRNGIVHLDCWSIKIFPLLGFCPLWFLSFWAFVLLCFCPFWLFSVRPRDRTMRMLIVHTCIMWSHEQKWDRTPWLLEYKNIFSFGGFVRFDFYTLGLLSYGAFVHFGFSLSTHMIARQECWLSTPVSCDHINRNGIVHLDCWSIKIFPLLGVLSALIFIIRGFCPMVLLSILAFLCPPTWSHDENVDCPHLYHVITWREMGSYTLIVGV